MLGQGHLATVRQKEAAGLLWASHSVAAEAQKPRSVAQQASSVLLLQQPLSLLCRL